MKKLVNELIEREINYWVAKCECLNNPIIRNNTVYITCHDANVKAGLCDVEFDPCNNPVQSWSIIEREKITIYPYNGMWVALSLKKGKRIYGDTSLIAAMRCRIAMVYGDSVEVDDEQKRT